MQTCRTQTIVKDVYNMHRVWRWIFDVIIIYSAVYNLWCTLFFNFLTRVIDTLTLSIFQRRRKLSLVLCWCIALINIQYSNNLSLTFCSHKTSLWSLTSACSSSFSIFLIIESLCLQLLSPWSLKITFSNKAAYIKVVIFFVTLSDTVSLVKTNATLYDITVTEIIVVVNVTATIFLWSLCFGIRLSETPWWFMIV